MQCSFEISMPDLLAGWSRYPITPPLGQPMAGYIARRGRARGVHNQLFVRALVLQHGKVRAGIVVADLLLISNKWSVRIRRRLARALKTSPEHVLVAATHTHSGPQVDSAPFQFCSSSEPRHNDALLRMVEKRMEQAIRAAMKSLQPVHVAVGHSVIHGVASDRNRPKRSTTQSFHLFRFEGRTTRAVFAIYGCHPTVLGANNVHYSGDLHGEIARRFERHADIALIANGAAANISTRFTREDQTPSEVSRLAGLLMKQALKAHLRPLEAPILSARTAILRLSVRNLRIKKKTTLPGFGRLGVVAQEALVIRRQLLKSLRFARKQRVAVPITVLRLGTIFLAALPFEVYASTGNFLWKKARITLLCYANGYWGYVPARSAASGDYEVVSSPFSSPADEQIRRAVLSLAKHK